MLRRYGIAAFDVGDCAGDFENAVVGPGGQAEAVHGCLHESLGVRIYLTILADVAGLHMGVCVDAVGLEPLLLYRPGGGDAVADRSRRLSGNV